MLGMAKEFRNEVVERKSCVFKFAFFRPLFMLLILANFARSEVNIPSECRIPNKSADGRCGWCALETLARRHGIRSLYGLAEKYPSRTRPRDLEAAVAASEVRYHIQQRGCRRTEILRDAINHDLGAIVGFRPAYPGAGGHIVTLVDFGPTKVRYLDSNDKDDRVRTMDLDSFLEEWDGFALVLERP
jgi:hypothetical protein